MNNNDNITNTIDYIHEFIIIHENKWYSINMIDNIHEFIIIHENNWYTINIWLIIFMNLS
jgi:hypothetical protein